MSNIETKQNFFSYESKYEELYLPDNNSNNLISRRAANNIIYNPYYENISNRNFVMQMTPNFKTNNDTNENNINYPDENGNKTFLRKNLIYGNNNIKTKGLRPLGFDIHIKDADDSAFEKMIID